jgi:hypothetical protein
VAAAAKANAPATRTAALVIKPEPRSEKSTPEKTAEKTASVPLPTAKPVKPTTYQVASADSKPVAKLAEAKPAETFDLASTTSKPVILASDDDLSKPSVRPAQAASLVARANMTANDIINERGYWQGLPTIDAADVQQVSAPRATPAPRRAVTTASADPASTASVTPWPLLDRSQNEPLPSALAYAAQPTPIAAARAVPMGPGTARAPAAETTVVVKRSDDRPSVTPPNVPTKPATPSLVRVGDRFNDPWLRAMIVSPSAQSFMRTSIYGIPDFRSLGPHMLKPASTVMMTFSDDPYLGMSSERFAGSAVVFTPTVTFNSPRTAALR